MKRELIKPMYRLNSIENIEDVIYDEQDVVFFRRDYSLEERKIQFEALEWAMNNPDYDFKGISPIFKNLKFSNKKIFFYLKRLFEFMRIKRLNIE